MPHSAEAAYGAAHRELTDVLTRAGAASPHEEAREFLQSLIRAGWCWRRREVPPPRGAGAEPTEEYRAWRKRLREEAAAREATEQAAGQLALDETTTEEQR